MTAPAWWQNAVAYQIYPRSFADANGDGIGDLPGIIDRLDYLHWLGITAVWISPFYPSPLLDVGYDIADYTDVDPAYGTLDDFDRLLAEAHARGIHILLDLVLNHTSDQHAWFVESRSSRDNPRRDWYIWRDGKNGEPPNNWESFFGDSAWQYDEASGQYYYHAFYPEQPDLNWRNPDVQQAMFDVVRFWLDRGIDGFRLDALGTLFEMPDFPDAPPEATMAELMMERLARPGRVPAIERRIRHKFQHQLDQPEAFDVMLHIRRMSDAYGDRVLLGETDLVKYYGNGHNLLHSVFNFDLLDIGQLNAAAIHALLANRLPSIPQGGWEANTIGNHDRTRSMTLFADGRHDDLRIRMALAMVMFLWGTPVFYNGEEIGMCDLAMPDVETFRDIRGVHAYQALLAAGFEAPQALRLADQVSRDRNRTPMQWENAPNGGFSPPGVQPWLPVHPNYAAGINVADQRQDQTSLLHYFRRLVQVRQAHPALRQGDMNLLENTEPVLAFWRDFPDERCLVALNMLSEPAVLAVPDGAALDVIFSSMERESVAEPVALAPYEVLVARLA